LAVSVRVPSQLSLLQVIIITLSNENLLASRTKRPTKRNARGGTQAIMTVEARMRVKRKTKWTLMRLSSNKKPRLPKSKKRQNKTILLKQPLQADPTTMEPISIKKAPITKLADRLWGRARRKRRRTSISSELKTRSCK
jgi:hypothetical protein